MSDDYYKQSTLYALACVLAYKRILLLDGVYSQVGRLKLITSAHLGSFLKENLKAVDEMLDKIQILANKESSQDSGKRTIQFYTYERQALAETVMEERDNRWRSCTFLEFRRRYNDESRQVKSSIEDASKLIMKIKEVAHKSQLIDNDISIRKVLDDLVSLLAAISQRLERETDMPSRIKKNR